MTDFPNTRAVLREIAKDTAYHNGQEAERTRIRDEVNGRPGIIMPGSGRRYIDLDDVLEIIGE